MLSTPRAYYSTTWQNGTEATLQYRDELLHTTIQSVAVTCMLLFRVLQMRGNADVLHHASPAVGDDFSQFQKHSLKVLLDQGGDNTEERAHSILEMLSHVSCIPNISKLVDWIPLMSAAIDQRLLPALKSSVKDGTCWTLSHGASETLRHGLEFLKLSFRACGNGLLRTEHFADVLGKILELIPHVHVACNNIDALVRYRGLALVDELCRWFTPSLLDRSGESAIYLSYCNKYWVTFIGLVNTYELKSGANRMIQSQTFIADTGSKVAQRVLDHLQWATSF
jgi:hypothetical protein